MIRAVSLTLAATLCLAATAPETRLAAYMRLRQEAATAAQAGDLAKAEARLEAALEIVPHSPGVLIRLARVEVAAGKPEEAIQHLLDYANLNLSWDIAADPGLKELLSRPDTKDVAAYLIANGQFEDSVEVAARLPAGNDIHEAVLPYRGGFLVSSVTGRSIVLVKDGKVSPVFRPDTATGGLFGMAFDGTSLWVTEAAGPDIPGSTGPARTALLQIDLDSGRVLHRYSVPDTDGPHQLGDVLVTADAIFASDARSGQIWRLARGDQTLKAIVPKGELGSPQGMAVCRKDVLLVADYTLGLQRLDLKTGRIEAVEGDFASAGTDGLFVIPDFNGRPDLPVFVLTQNGLTPEGVLFMGLHDDCREIGFNGFLVNKDSMADLTLGAVDGDGFVFLSRSGWAAFDAEGKRRPDAPPTETLILRHTPMGLKPR